MTLAIMDPSKRKVHLITYENTDHKHLKHLRRSARHFGWPEVTVLGKDEEWLGFGTKIFAYTKYLKTLPGTDVAIIIDARDVLVNGTPSEFLKWFNPSSSLFVSAEYGCCAEGVPNITETEKQWMESRTDNPNRYLNSGMIAGLVSSFQKIYPFGMLKVDEDDQNAMVHYWMKHPDDIVLDYDEILFSNATWSPNSESYAFGNGRWISKSSKKPPIFIQTQAKNWDCYKKLSKLHETGQGAIASIITILVVLYLSFKFFA
jgi:hypothetical protein